MEEKQAFWLTDTPLTLKWINVSFPFLWKNEAVSEKGWAGRIFSDSSGRLTQNKEALFRPKILSIRADFVGEKWAWN